MPAYHDPSALPPGAVLDSYDEMPTRLEMAVALFTRTGTRESNGAVHARSVRIPSIENVTIEALAQHSGLSFNKVIVQLLEVALDEVFQAMPAEQRAQVLAKRGALMAEMCDKDGFPVFPGAERPQEGDI
jgi:hypothetical protein